jgi:ABC-type molybdate transport system permease subunit
MTLAEREEACLESYLNKRVEKILEGKLESFERSMGNFGAIRSQVSDISQKICNIEKIVVATPQS